MGNDVALAPDAPKKPERTGENYATVKLSDRKIKKFLSTLRRTGKVSFSARAAGYADSSYMHKLKAADANFAKAWDEALNAAHDMLEDEAMRRAVEGVDKPVMYKGEVVAYEKEYSDQLLMFLLRGNRPDKFRDNVQVIGTINHNVGIAILPLQAPRLEDWERAALEVQGSQKLLAPRVDDVDEDGQVVRSPTLVRR